MDSIAISLVRVFSNSLDCIGLVNLYHRHPIFCFHQSLFKIFGLYWFSESLPTFFKLLGLYWFSESSKILFIIRIISNSMDCIGLVNLYRRPNSYIPKPTLKSFLGTDRFILSLHKLHHGCTEADNANTYLERKAVFLETDFSGDHFSGDHFFIQLRKGVPFHHLNIVLSSVDSGVQCEPLPPDGKKD